MAAGLHYQEVRHSATSTTTDSATTPPPSPDAPPIRIHIEPTEKTPLLGAKKTTQSSSSSLLLGGGGGGKKSEFGKSSSGVGFLFDVKALLIGMLLLFGVGIATYLLIVDTRLPPIGLEVSYVNSDVWSSSPGGYFQRRGLNQQPNVENIVVTQTGGEDCYNMEDCISLLRAMEVSYSRKNDEIPYNFMVSGDGQIYEGQGWTNPHRLSFIPKENSIVIGFIGNFTVFEPADDQMNAAKGFLQESVQRRRIQRDYRLYGIQNLTISHQDASALYNRVSQWPHFDTILKVL